MQLEPSFSRDSGTFRWWEEEELRDLCAAVGLQDFQRTRSNRYILFSASKPLA